MSSGSLDPSAPLAEEIRTPRLRLALVTPAQAADLRDGREHPRFAPGFPGKDDLDAISMVRAGNTWGPRLVIRGNDGLICGTIGFFGPPAVREEEPDGPLETEVGYGLVPVARGHGVAAEALQGLVNEADARGVRVRAAVEPSNASSLRTLAECGFTELRGSDEDGRLVMVRPLPASGT